MELYIKSLEYVEWRYKWVIEHANDFVERDAKHYNKWIQDFKHIDAIESHIDRLFFYDGETENPSYFIAKIFETCYTQALKDNGVENV